MEVITRSRRPLQNPLSRGERVGVRASHAANSNGSSVFAGSPRLPRENGELAPPDGSLIGVEEDDCSGGFQTRLWLDQLTKLSAPSYQFVLIRSCHDVAMYTTGIDIRGQGQGGFEEGVS